MVAILVSVVISVDARMRLCIAAVILPERSPLALCPLNQPLMATLSRDDVFAVRHFTLPFYPADNHPLRYCLGRLRGATGPLESV